MTVETLEPNVRASNRAKATLDFHRKHAGLEGGDDIILWQLLCDLMDFARENRVDFEKTLASVREEMRTDG